MLRLYSAGVGSNEMTLQQRVHDSEGWVETRRQAAALLRARNQNKSADLLESAGFEIHAGSNVFNDKFYVLYLLAPPDDYIQYERKSKDDHFRGMIFANRKRSREDLGMVHPVCGNRHPA